MGKPLVDLPDAEKVVIGILEAAGYTTVKTDYPSSRLTGADYWLQVDQEPGGVSGYPVTERVQVRVTAHAGYKRRTAVKLLASDVLADLYSFIGSATVAGIKPLGGRSAVSTDPATENVMCWVLVRVDLLASLAS